MRSDLEEVLWSHLENVIAPEVMMFQMHDPDDQPQVISELQFWLQHSICFSFVVYTTGTVHNGKLFFFF